LLLLEKSAFHNTGRSMPAIMKPIEKEIENWKKSLLI